MLGPGNVQHSRDPNVTKIPLSLRARRAIHVLDMAERDNGDGGRRLQARGDHTGRSSERRRWCEQTSDEEDFQELQRKRRRNRGGTQDGGTQREGQREGNVRGGPAERGGGNKVDVVMWICKGLKGKGCGAHSFLSRFKCHVCLRPRPRFFETTKEAWNLDGLPANVAAEHVHGPRPPPDRPPAQHRDARQLHTQRARHPQSHQQQQHQVPLAGGGRGLQQRHQREAEVDGGDREDEDDDYTGDELTFANIVRKTTRPKAKAKQAAKAQQSEQQPRPGPQQQDVGQDPAPPRPYQPPPLPRGLLAARTSALEAKIKKMQESGAAGEELKRAEARLESTRRMLKQAGGQTQRKLHFEMLEGDRRVARAVTSVEQAEQALGEAEKELLAAVDKRDRACAHLENEQVKLTNARAHHAHLTLQAAVEVNAYSNKYLELHRGMVELRATLEGMQGMGAALDVLQQAAHFFGAFAPTEYRAEDDPMVRDPDADGNQSEPTDLEAAGEMGDDNQLHTLDAVAQAQADLDDLREQANQAAAGAVRAVADRAAAIVGGESAGTSLPSPATMVQQFAQRMQEAEARLEEAKQRHASQQQQPQQQSVVAAAAMAPSFPSEGTASGAAAAAALPTQLPAAFVSAARAAVVPLPPETASLPAAFASRPSTKPAGRCRWPQFERRFPPAEGGPRGRARSLDDERGSRKRSRSGPGRLEERVDQHGVQVIDGDSD